MNDEPGKPGGSQDRPNDPGVSQDRSDDALNMGEFMEQFRSCFGDEAKTTDDHLAQLGSFHVPEPGQREVADAVDRAAAAIAEELDRVAKQKHHEERIARILRERKELRQNKQEVTAEEAAVRNVNSQRGEPPARRKSAIVHQHKRKKRRQRTQRPTTPIRTTANGVDVYFHVGLAYELSGGVRCGLGLVANQEIDAWKSTPIKIMEQRIHRSFIHQSQKQAEAVEGFAGGCVMHCVGLGWVNCAQVRFAGNVEATRQVVSDPEPGVQPTPNQQELVHPYFSNQIPSPRNPNSSRATANAKMTLLNEKGEAVLRLFLRGGAKVLAGHFLRITYGGSAARRTHAQNFRAATSSTAGREAASSTVSTAPAAAAATVSPPPSSSSVVVVLRKRLAKEARSSCHSAKRRRIDPPPLQELVRSTTPAVLSRAQVQRHARKNLTDRNRKRKSLRRSRRSRFRQLYFCKDRLADFTVVKIQQRFGCPYGGVIGPDMVQRFLGLVERRHYLSLATAHSDNKHNMLILSLEQVGNLRDLFELGAGRQPAALGAVFAGLLASNELSYRPALSIDNLQYVLCPIHHQGHWSLVKADLPQQRLFFYESCCSDEALRRDISVSVQAIGHAFAWWTMAPGEQMPEVGWQVEVVRGLASDSSPRTCPVFLCAHALAIATGQTLNFNQRDSGMDEIPNFLRLIVNSLLQGRIDGDSD
jgi:hypothetical protein